jgi:hypothetical protein
VAGEYQEDMFGPGYWNRVDSGDEPIVFDYIGTEPEEAQTLSPQNSDEAREFLQPACPGCPFAGAVEDLSVHTGRATPPDEAISVLFDDRRHTTGSALIHLGGDDYGTGDDNMAIDAAVSSIKECRENGNGPLVARRTVLGVTVGKTVVACGAYFTQDRPNGRPELKPGILKVTDANE